ncbi:MAG: 2-C-methyl-D-erythritol 4-phosphate cytidylyltransferase [Opitutales bacterium]
MSSELNCAILLAAGSGSRMQGAVEDKILAMIHGRPVFYYSLNAFAACDSAHILCIVYRDEAQQEKLAEVINHSIRQEVIWVRGGTERQESVLNGLEALPKVATHTLIHDCARPLITSALIEQLIEATRRDGAASLAHPVTDTIKRIPCAGSLQSTELEDLDRNRLWAMETPQAFRHADILKAYRHVKNQTLQLTDDCAAAASIGIKTTLIHNRAPNLKITSATDLDYIKAILNKADSK